MDISAPLFKALRGAFRLSGSRKSENTFPTELPKLDFDYVPRKLSDHFTVGFAKESILPNDLVHLLII